MCVLTKFDLEVVCSRNRGALSQIYSNSCRVVAASMNADLFRLDKRLSHCQNQSHEKMCTLSGPMINYAPKYLSFRIITQHDVTEDDPLVLPLTYAEAS